MTKRYALTEDEKATLVALLADVSRLPEQKHVAVKKNPMPEKSLLSDCARLSTVLDLHGFTLAKAHAQLASFISAHHEAKTRKVTVITGKSGELARDVPRWLTLTDLAHRVSSVSHAEQRRGGEGALVVKLKKHDR